MTFQAWASQTGRRVLDRMERAFTGAPRPDCAIHACSRDECRDLEEWLKGRTPRTLPIAGFEYGERLSLLTPDGLRYFLPGFVRLAIEPGNHDLLYTLIATLADPFSDQLMTLQRDEVVAVRWFLLGLRDFVDSAADEPASAFPLASDMLPDLNATVERWDQRLAVIDGRDPKPV